MLSVVAAICSAEPPALGVETAVSDQLQLKRRLDEIESRLQRLEAGGSDRWLVRRRAREIRNLVADLIADADTRAMRLADRPTGGYDDGFFLASADRDFTLELSGQLQVRHVWNRRGTSAKDETRAGFEGRRIKLKAKGRLLGRTLAYTVGMARSRGTGTFRLQTLALSFRLSDELRLLLGRSRPPLLREESISSKRQLATERSLVQKAFRQIRW